MLTATQPIIFHDDQDAVCHGGLQTTTGPAGALTRNPPIILIGFKYFLK
jgi:hypothetical protein